MGRSRTGPGPRTLVPHAVEESLRRDSPSMFIARVCRQPVKIHLLDTLLDLVATIELEPGTTPRRYLSPQGNGLDELRLRLTMREAWTQTRPEDPDR